MPASRRSWRASQPTRLQAGVDADAWQVPDPSATALLIFAAIHQTVDEIVGGAAADPTLAALERAVAPHRPFPTPKG
jgi:hypothetical protein